MGEWSEDHGAAISSLNSNFGTFGRFWLNYRPGGNLRCKVETVDWEGQRMICGKWHLQGCSPYLCGLRTDGLAPMSKY
jgi:hypothetical protein